MVLFHGVQARRVASFLVLGAIQEGTVNIFLAVDGWVVLCGVGVTPFGKLMDLPFEPSFVSHSLYD